MFDSEGVDKGSEEKVVKPVKAYSASLNKMKAKKFK